MNTSATRTRILTTIGFIGMIIGAMDPMEGALIILPSSALVLLGTYLSHSERKLITFRLWVFLMTAVGVAAMVVFSLLGGIGGSTQYSMWWGLLILPYPVAWSVSIWGPDSPRWVLWLGIGVSVWYLAIFAMLLKSTFTAGADEGTIVGIVLGIIGVLTIGGCIYRLRKINV